MFRPPKTGSKFGACHPPSQNLFIDTLTVKNKNSSNFGYTGRIELKLKYFGELCHTNTLAHHMWGRTPKLTVNFRLQYFDGFGVAFGGTCFDLKL